MKNKARVMEFCVSIYYLSEISYPNLFLPKSWKIFMAPILSLVRVMCWYAMLLPSIRPPCRYCIHPGLDNGLQDIQVDLSVDLQACWEDMGWHHIPLIGDNCHDHYCCWKLCLHDNWHFSWVFAEPPVVLPIDFLVLLENLHPRRKSSRFEIEDASID